MNFVLNDKAKKAAIKREIKEIEGEIKEAKKKADNAPANNANYRVTWREVQHKLEKRKRDLQAKLKG